MENDGKTEARREMVGDIPVRTEEIGFSHADLIECAKCTKLNSPQRGACLYCGSALATEAAADAAEHEADGPLEEWEKGYNVVITHVPDSGALSAAADLLGIEAEVMTLFAHKRLPAARVETEALAMRVLGNLNKVGVDGVIVADEHLRMDIPNIRLRGLEFRNDSVVFLPFNDAEPVSVPTSEVALIVSGIIVERSSETIEKRKKGSVEVLDEKFSHSDEGLIDIFTSKDPIGYRIRTHGFDFSCLGDDKSMLAGQNMERLFAKLVNEFPKADTNAVYGTVRPLLDIVWPIEDRRESLGFQRIGRLGRKELAHAQHSSNRIQFDRYSRLQYALL